MSVNNVPPFNPYLNDNLQAKSDKKGQKRLEQKEKIKTSYDLYQEKKKGLTRDQKTYMKAGVVAVGLGLYLAISGKGAKLIDSIKELFTDAV